MVIPAEERLVNLTLHMKRSECQNIIYHISRKKLFDFFICIFKGTIKGLHQFVYSVYLCISMGDAIYLDVTGHVNRVKSILVCSKSTHKIEAVQYRPILHTYIHRSHMCPKRTWYYPPEKAKHKFIKLVSFLISRSTYKHMSVRACPNMSCNC